MEVQLSDHQCTVLDAAYHAMLVGCAGHFTEYNERPLMLGAVHALGRWHALNQFSLLMDR